MLKFALFGGYNLIIKTVDLHVFVLNLDQHYKGKPEQSRINHQIKGSAMLDWFWPMFWDVSVKFHEIDQDVTLI